ncbi:MULTISPECIES: VapE domain-containing protein [unclassified Blautia]|uniref:VapE domain-containing protein n=1 Tax=unclassified Blautia TaxID=2648079 RepID=UPI003F89383A
MTDSKIYEHLRGHWIMEMSEMIAAISAKSNEEIKSFLTRQKDTYRNPYDKYEEDRKRQCIFAGSTNTRQFIPFDRTGARHKNSLLKFSKEMEQEISEYWKQFTQEDTMAGMIQGWLDAYKGTHVCSVQIWKEAFDHFDREPKKFETNEICSIMDTQITGWKRAGVHRFSKEGYGRQRSWIREGSEEEGGNEPDKDGFTKLTKAEQLELPFDLPDREKG